MINRKTFTIAAIAQAALTFLFLIIAIVTNGSAELAMKILSLIFTAGTLACSILAYMNRTIKMGVSEKPAEPTPTPAEPTPTPAQ